MLRELIRSLEIMECELGTNNIPLPALMCLLAQTSGMPVRAFYETMSAQLTRLGEISFADLWGQAVRKDLPDIGDRDRQALGQLGQHLGRYELPQQLRALRNCVNSLSASLREACARYPDQQKLGMGLAVSAGILFWIVLV